MYGHFVSVIFSFLLVVFCYRQNWNLLDVMVSICEDKDEKTI